MNAIPFDTLKMARKLEAAGFPGPQAAGAAEAMSGAELATKADLLTVKVDLQHEIGLVRTDMTAMETRLNTAIIGVRTNLEPLRRDITIRLGAMIIGGVGIILTAMRFMAMHP